jgi:hypothetical protein
MISASCQKRSYSYKTPVQRKLTLRLACLVCAIIKFRRVVYLRTLLSDGEVVFIGRWLKEMQ